MQTSINARAHYIEHLISCGLASPAARGMPPQQVVDQINNANASFPGDTSYLYLPEVTWTDHEQVYGWTNWDTREAATRLEDTEELMRSACGMSHEDLEELIAARADDWGVDAAEVNVSEVHAQLQS